MSEKSDWNNKIWQVLAVLWISIITILVMVASYKGAHELATKKMDQYIAHNWRQEGWRSIIHCFDMIITVLLIPFGVSFLIALIFENNRKEISMISCSIILVPSLIAVGAVLIKWLRIEKKRQTDY